MDMKVDERIRAFVDLREGGCSIDAEDWTEADTRSKFIDTVLKDCLGWEESNIHRELSKDRKRLDYLLSTTRPVLVVEAKKASHDFPVLKALLSSRCQIDRFMRANPGIREAMLQVVDYCRRFSAPLAVLTNGRTYITFVAVRTDGVPWDEGDAMVFADIFDGEFNFSYLYNLLARHSIIAGNLVAELLTDGVPIQAQNVLSTYVDPNAIVPRNPIGLALEPLLVQVFSDVTRSV
jgi:hypothetical protein